MEAKVYDIKGKEKSSVSVPENIFGVRWNADLVDQVVTSLMSSKRKNIAHTKTRGEVRGGGKKPWQQKGTGRARHGSTRSPIWKGGGVTHGPRNDQNYDRKVSKKMKAKALYTILSKKYRDGEVIFVDSLKLSSPKTKEAISAFKGLAGVKGYENLFSKRKNAAVVALSEKNLETERSMRNLGNMEVIEARNLHPLALLQYKFVVIENPEISLGIIPGLNLFSKKDEEVKAKPVAKKNTKASAKPKAKAAKKTKVKTKAKVA